MDRRFYHGWDGAPAELITDGTDDTEYLLEFGELSSYATAIRAIRVIRDHSGRNPCNRAIRDQFSR